MTRFYFIEILMILTKYVFNVSVRLLTECSVTECSVTLRLLYNQVMRVMNTLISQGIHNSEVQPHYCWR